MSHLAPWTFVVCVCGLFAAPETARAAPARGIDPSTPAEVVSPGGTVNVVPAPKPDVGPVVDKTPVPKATDIGKDPPAKKAQAEADSATKKPEKDPHRLEYGALPAINYDSDLGFGFGAVGTLVRFHPGINPFRWRLMVQLYATVKRKPTGGAEFPFHEDVIELDVPGLLDNRLRLNAALRFIKFSNTGYYGLGNAAVAEKPWEQIDEEMDPDGYRAARRYHQYDRTYPNAELIARFNVWDRTIPAHKRRLEVFTGAAFSYSVMSLYEGSELEQDVETRATDTPDGRELSRLLAGTENHALLVLKGGLLWDTRDHEFMPTRGTFSELAFRLSPGVSGGLLYGGVTANTRWFFSLYRDYLVVATRVVGDLIFGTAPVYELARFDGLQPRDAPGGGWAVRGVPRQRYHGKAKLVGNFELRSMFYRFKIKEQRFGLGAAAFVDTGRVWLDYRDVELDGMDSDGKPSNFKVGLGGGLRVSWGETFVIRIEPGYSVTEKNFGLYINVGHLF